MNDQRLADARDGLRARMPASVADAAVLRAEVRAADAAVGELLKAAAARRDAHPGIDREGARHG